MRIWHHSHWIPFWVNKCTNIYQKRIIYYFKFFTCSHVNFNHLWPTSKPSISESYQSLTMWIIPSISDLGQVWTHSIATSAAKIFYPHEIMVEKKNKTPVNLTFLYLSEAGWKIYHLGVCSMTIFQGNWRSNWEKTNHFISTEINIYRCLYVTSTTGTPAVTCPLWIKCGKNTINHILVHAW